MCEHLFDAELVYRSEMEPLTWDGEGELIGSGDGSVAGPAIAGQLAWTLFERPGKLVCAMNPLAVIKELYGSLSQVFGERELANFATHAAAIPYPFKSSDYVDGKVTFRLPDRPTRRIYLWDELPTKMNATFARSLGECFATWRG